MSASVNFAAREVQPPIAAQRRERAPDLSVRREALRGCSLFGSLTPADRDAVLARAVLKRFTRGDLIMRRGDPAPGMSVILQGCVRIGVTSTEGQETSLAMLGPGDVVGEMALLDGGERSTDVIAVEDGVMLLIQRSDILSLMEKNARLCLGLMHVLCVRLRSANRSIEELATLSLPTRLGRLLLRLAKSYGKRTDRGLRIELRLSQKDLANLAGASRGKINHCLRLWEQQGVLLREHGHFLIRLPDTLAAGEP
jgi:CRP/FNR family cyclic AMP-dependent transcriptional regulator